MKLSHDQVFSQGTVKDIRSSAIPSSSQMHLHFCLSALTSNEKHQNLP